MNKLKIHLKSYARIKSAALISLTLLIISSNLIAQSVNPSPSWRVQARCFQDGPSGSFDNIAVKDPSIVNSGGRYHLFYTGRDNSLWRIGYASATSISGLNSASHILLNSLNGGSYFAAPQVFWFGAKNRWYLIYQSGLGATFSTNTDVGNPNGWAPGQAMGFTDGIDFWCISDGSNVYCFYSPQDGSRTIKRRSTTVANFPTGWSSPSTVATSTFEAPHVYRNIADGRYYMIVEDLARHQELWTATNPGGTWTKLSEEWAHRNDLIYQADQWTHQVSHMEIIRAGTDERLEVANLNNCTMLFQGVVDGSYGDYANIPYDLGTATNGGGGGSNTIVVRARGTNGSESIQLRVNNTTIATWTLTTSMANYTATTSSTGGITVNFTNDATGRDVQVDYIQVNGSTRQAESQATNTGVWQNSQCGGSNSEWLHCNGYIGFGNVPKASDPEEDVVLKTVPSSYVLHQNYPNPFNPSTTINYELAEVSYVRLTVYDLVGREVKTLVNETQSAGYHTAEFNAENIPSGVYFYRLEANGRPFTNKMILMK